MENPTTPRPPTHVRTRSGFSFGSHKSKDSVPKMDLTESPKDKIPSQMNTKADPNKAMQELQPISVAQEKSTIAPLRSIQHRDTEGNIIDDPDKSNPTRPRMERPLDTIRGFEAAINGTTDRRMSSRPSPSRPVSTYGSTYGGSTYGSTYGSSNGPHKQIRRSTYNDYSSVATSQPRYIAEDKAYYNGQNSSRPTSYHDAYQQGNYGRRGNPRTFSDPMLYGNSNSGNYNGQNGNYQAHGNGQGRLQATSNGVYNGSYDGYAQSNGHSYQQSYDATTASTANSNGTEPWASSTNPSSENSSNDRINQVVKAEPVENYGFTGFGGGIPYKTSPIFEEHGAGKPAYGQPGYGTSYSNPRAGPAYQGNSVPLPIPPQSPQQAYQPAPNRFSRPGQPTRASLSNMYDVQTNGRTNNSEKRKSWFKRAFSSKG